MATSGPQSPQPGSEDTGLEFPLPQEALEEAEITRIARELAQAQKKTTEPPPHPPAAPSPPGSRKYPGVQALNKAQLSPTAGSTERPASDPYFSRVSETPSSGEVPALRPLSQAVISPVPPPSSGDSV
ncbi:hypothetical protein EDM80_15855, partial [bacterium]